MEKEENKCCCEESKKCNCTEENKECNCKEEDKECNSKTCECEDSSKEKKKEKKKDKGQVKKLKEEIELLKEKNKKALEDVLIAKADMINYRKRKEEELERYLKFCNEDLIKDLLPVIDNFERAIKLSEGKIDESFIKLSEGYKMVYAGLENILEKYEVKAIDGHNKEFDPVYHNAVMTEKIDGIEPGMVVEVLQKGYLYKDKVIRPAMVKVSE